ncbi:MAG TPA: MFS transporter [Actinomycetota bacterium]|jgi:MFS family permease|nr:MFS transporter [Actinomycetota bacterium]
MNRLLSHVGPPLRALQAVLRNRRITRMQLAFLLFNVAEPAMWVAIFVYAFEQGGTKEVGIVSILVLVPAGVLAPVAAALGDRFRRELVVRSGYLAQSVTTGVTAVALAAGAPPAVVYVLAAIAAITFTTGRPNHHALTPLLSESPEQVAAANSVSSLAEGIGYTAGGILAAVLADSGAGAVFAGAAVALLLGTLLTLGVRTHANDREAGPFRPWTLAADAAIGMTILIRAPGTRLLVFLAGVVAISSGALGVLMVPLAVQTLGLGDAGVGFLTTMISVGLLVGAGASVVFAARRRLTAPIVLGAAIFAVSGVLFGWTAATMVAVIASIVYGAALTLLDVLGRTMLQRTTTDDVLTRVFGAVEALWLLGYAGGAALAPVLDSWLGLSWAFATAGLAVIATALAITVGLRAIDAKAVLPERQLSLLARIPMFTPLPRMDLERLARQLDRIDTPAGTEVIRQGDVGDRFYVIDGGRFEIVIDGKPIAVQTEGDYFGEIALLQDVPRTATVRAIEDGAVWALDQEEFLATLTDLPQAASAAHAISTERLRTAQRSTSA